MTGWLAVFGASLRLELARLVRARLFLAVALLQAVGVLILVSMFGLTGSRAPTAYVDQDHGFLAARFAYYLEHDYSSFDLRPMGAGEANAQLQAGRLVAVVTIPPGFTDRVARGWTVAIDVAVDNVNVDLADDIQRALPAAASHFARDRGLPEIRVTMWERDALTRDTDFVPYLVVSALALDALLLAGVLAAISVAGEWEGRTLRVWRLAPGGPGALLAGKVAAVGLLAGLGMASAAAVVMLTYGVRPVHPAESAGAVVACVLVSACLGAWLGAWLKRTLVAVPIVFGMSIPLYVDSGSLEPVRFDGDLIWVLAHGTPLYYLVGLLEWGFHGLLVTPESPLVDLAVAASLAVLAFVGARRSLARGRLA